MGRDAKKYDCPPSIYQIRSELPVLPATGNSHWSNPDAICHQMTVTPHQKHKEADSMAFEILKSQGFDTLPQAPLALANQIGHRLVTSFASTVFDRFFRSSGEILFNKFGDLQYNSNSRLIAL